MDEIYNSIICHLKNDFRILALLLGGSRARGNYNYYSDYDLFALISPVWFTELINTFSNDLEKCPVIKYAAEYSYVENWGYIFKVVGLQNNKLAFFDISVLPINRISEMGIRSSNIIIFDKTEKINKYKECNNSLYETRDLEILKKLDYVKLFGFEYLRFEKSCNEDDYWLAFKALDRMRIYFMRYNRIKNEIFSNTQHCPEKRYSLDFANDKLSQIFIIDGTIKGLKKVCESLVDMFYKLIDEKEIVSFYKKIRTL